MKWFHRLWRRLWRLDTVYLSRIPLGDGNVTLTLNAGAESIACCPGDDWERRVEPDGTVVVTNREPVTFAIRGFRRAITIRCRPPDFNTA